ncbi:P-loop containing nucleoside triphosphate hydrolase protein [Calycina marina]|uniref:P-loop containing nucleoside triphosphate hydrolase protein n=1 Tax=Calycina marina TaxID=1763456 RepID=A0A9P7Z4Z8_9HELO|nr:P-loop containing nucleoside triphosphate hydrolase protein [Calycina marina]
MSVQVVARIRPLLDKELDKDTIVRAEPSVEGQPANLVRIPNPKNEAEEFSFAFNSVYDMATSQEELYATEVAPHLKSLFKGLDVTIFAYGVTGTGKTHTMRGGLKLAERGVIPRLLSGIYRRGKKIRKDTNEETQVTVTLSYYEIYNDKVYDLFEIPEKRTLAGLRLCEKDGKTIVVNLSERPCADLKDFEKLYIEANNNRSTAGTKLNAESSRSHAVLMVKVIQTTGDSCLTSTASAIDLAGSEDNRRTENGKERMVESASINKSLFVLSQCIDAIGRGDKRIPYRESKMTRILSLGQNNGITIMILNLAPLRSYHLDTLSSLNVSSRAKRIEVREIENEVVFTQPPRKTGLSGTSISRQPLRPLANAHNSHVNVPVPKVGDKPMKAFAVYSDKSRSAGPHVATHAPREIGASKRPSDSTMSARPGKMSRSNPVEVRAALELSTAKIEELIERKVSEALATRATEQPAAAAPDSTSEEVKRRLEALERRITSEEDPDRAEGLRLLQLAKDHKDRGDYSRALAMYQTAQPYFPNEQKLLGKIEFCRQKIQQKREEASKSAESKQGSEHKKTVATQPPTTATSFRVNLPKPQVNARPQQAKAEPDDDEINLSFVKPEYEEDGSFACQSSKAKKTNRASKSTMNIFTDSQENMPVPTPRTKQLLDIVNSRDVNIIKGLSGVGAKKARDLVEFLDLQNDEQENRVRSLKELERVPGLGGKTVARAYDGIV